MPWVVLHTYANLQQGRYILPCHLLALTLLKFKEFWNQKHSLIQGRFSLGVAAAFISFETKPCSSPLPALRLWSHLGLRDCKKAEKNAKFWPSKSTNVKQQRLFLTIYIYPAFLFSWQGSLRNIIQWQRAPKYKWLIPLPLVCVTNWIIHIFLSDRMPLSTRCSLKIDKFFVRNINFRVFVRFEN